MSVQSLLTITTAFKRQCANCTNEIVYTSNDWYIFNIISSIIIVIFIILLFIYFFKYIKEENTIFD